MDTVIYIEIVFILSNDVQYVTSQYDDDKFFGPFLEYEDHFHHHQDEAVGKSLKNTSIHMGKYMKRVHADSLCARLCPVDLVRKEYVHMHVYLL